MSKSNVRHALLANCLLMLVISPSGGLADDNDALANERFHSDPKLLQKQWRIDCDRAVKETQAWLREDQNNPPNWDNLPWRDLKLCGLLFNTPDTGRQIDCPNYTAAYKSLHAAKKQPETLNRGPLKVFLSPQCQNLKNHQVTDNP